jgi:photosystem II stability/assembly factor-like uncharacterized protein
MKFKIIYVSLFILSVSIYSQQSGWSFINPQPTNVILNSVKFINQNTAIVIGNHGTVFKTTDGGLNWSNPMSTSAVTGLEKLHYFNMNFFDQNTGLIIGDNSGGIAKLFKTSNAGATWSFVSQFAGLASAMHFINQNTGWIGNGTQVLKTTNGGSSWQTASTTFPSGIISILFLNPFTGFATASNKVFKSTDGGINWLMVSTLAGGSLNDLFFLNSQTGFTVGAGSNSIVHKTTNAGASWEIKLSGNLTGTLSSVYFINALTGFAVGGGYGNPPAVIFKTTDEGETWNQIPIATTNHLTSIGFSGNTAIAVGYGGTVGRSTDQGLSWIVPSGFHQQGGRTFQPLNFIDANTGWLSINGYTGTVPIYRSTNGGLNWVSIYTTSPALDWIQFLNANTGYYKRGNTLFKSTNSGYNWIQAAPLNITVNSINFADANTGYACGYTTSPLRPRLIRTINGGSTWDSIHVPPDYSSVTSFNFINPNTGWISIAYALFPMGTYSKIFRTTNGGISWDHLRTDSNVSHRKISFIDNLTGWAAANNLIKTTNGGNNWFTLPISGTMFQFINANTGWIQNNSASLYKTTNGGLNWYAQVDIGLVGIENMQFINSQTGWIVGAEGLVVKTTNGGELVGLNLISTEIPKEFSFSQNYPNPFNPVTNIKFQLPGSGFVKIIIYDLLGREITKLVNQQMQAGSYSADWDAAEYPSGVYFYKIEAGSFAETKKMILIK